MATLEPADLADLIKTTLKDLGRFKWTDISLSLQNHIAWNQLMNPHRVTFSSGRELQWNVQVSTSTQAKHVGLYDVDDVDVDDLMQTATVPWRNDKTSFAIEAHEITMNTPPAEVVDLVKVRRNAAHGAYANMKETDFWTNPADSTDKLLPLGVPYYIVYNATEGFNGGNPSGYTAGAGGLSTDDYSAWKNWTAQFTSVTPDDFVKKFRKASVFTRFIAPMRSSSSSYNTGDAYGYYASYPIITALETILETQNQNLGNGLGSKDGNVMFKGNHVTHAPKLDEKSNDVMYGINWGVFKFAFLRGWFMKQNGPQPMGNQRNVIRTIWDSTGDYICYDRRANFVLAAGDPGEGF